MSDVAALRLVDGADGTEAPSDEPKVFARSISIPSGAPWDQTRAARLEARAAAPLPLSEISYQVRRLDGWRPGQAAKFAAFYVRSGDIGLRLRADCMVDGRLLEVVFVSRAEREGQTRRAAGFLVAAAAGVVLTLTSVAVAISARHGAEAQLNQLEHLAETKARLARGVETERQEVRSLDAAGMRQRALSSYLADLDWASSAKAPGTRIAAVHWDHSVMAVEVRGDQAPFVDAGRTVTKMDKPIRPGVWLWGVDGSRSPARSNDAPAMGGGAP